MGGSNRDLELAQVCNYDFVTGYAWRKQWTDFESGIGQYNFSDLDDIIAKAQACDKKLAFLVGGRGGTEPSYIAANPSVSTWTDPETGTRAVPWDPYLQERFSAFVSALANHQLPNAAAGGTLTPLKNHPTLTGIHFGIPGLGLIREQGYEIESFPGYTRTIFLSALKDSLHAQTDNFPDKSVTIGFWAITDTQHSPELWEDIRQDLLLEFNGISNPKIGFYMENLAASKDIATGVVTGYPVVEFATPLYLSKNETSIDFQALTSWLQPFTGHEKVANGTPSDGIDYAYTTFGTTYFELYEPDLSHEPYQSGLRYWNNFLTAGGGNVPTVPAPPTGLIVS